VWTTCYAALLIASPTLYPLRHHILTDYSQRLCLVFFDLLGLRTRKLCVCAAACILSWRKYTLCHSCGWCNRSTRVLSTSWDADIVRRQIIATDVAEISHIIVSVRRWWRNSAMLTVLTSKLNWTQSAQRTQVFNICVRIKITEKKHTVLKTTTITSWADLYFILTPVRSALK